MRLRTTATYRLPLAAVAMTLIITCAAAAGPAAGAPPGELVTAEGLTRQAPAASAPTAAVVDGFTTFGYDLGRVTANPAENWVVSPLSIGYAFAMARAGASGETAKQLDRVFGFPPAGLHDAVNALTGQLGAIDGPPSANSAAGPSLCVANAIFAAPGLPIGQPFLRTLATQYGSGLRTVDFGSPAAAEAIDAWVREQTAGRIKKLFDSLGSNTRLVLANAVYFKADWQRPFGKSPTGSASFTLADGGTVQVPTMHHMESLRYAEGPGWQAVELPYQGGDLAMWVLVPDPSREAGELLATDVLSTVADSLKPTIVDLSLPKWDFHTDLDLLSALGALGFTEVAGFAGINPELYLGQAIHRATITVDEKGTEAAAVTGLAFESAGMAQPQVTVKADHPFAFTILHTPTRTPLFVGTVANP